MAHNNSPFSVRRINSPSTHHVSTVSTSPRPSSFSRPQWPWTPHTHSHTSSSQSSLPSVTATPAMNWEAGSAASTAWTARQSAGSAQGSVRHLQVEETIRQWNFTAFEWTVRNAHALRDFVEKEQHGTAAEGAEEPHEVLRESPMLGDGKFKLEIVRASNHESDPAAATPSSSPAQHVNTSSSLSLCVTSLLLDLAQGPEYEVTMMAAVKVQDNRDSERGPRADWVWEYWENEWSFRQDSEVWECTLPPLSTLLENSRIAETDSFVICIQIHSPFGPHFPQHPAASYVPRDLLDGVEASLDNSRKGDVKFICLERFVQPADPASPLISASPHSRRSSENSGYSCASSHPTARKRIIYAHSDILTRRSEYFHTMLASSFAENTSVPPGERKVYEIVVEEADFVTIYWLLKYCYANWVSFKEHDDPRASVDRMGEGWSAKWLSNRRGSEWDWKTFSKAGIYDAASTGSGEDDSNDKGRPSAESSVTGRAPSSVSQGKRPITVTSPSGNRAIPSSPSQSSPRVPPRLTTALAGGRSGTQSTTSSQRVSESSKTSPSTNKQVPVPSARVPSIPNPTFAYPISPRQSRASQQQQVTLDPHPHPTPPPPPASALSIWLIAHRYAMPGLSSLALAHMMNTIQPSSAISLLLATSRWEELHSLVEDYIVDQWDLACNSEEFEQCCQEVAAGEWGPEGGRTFAALFRRLRSR
ncbi:hypothetical protein K439DRAFT_1380451 [Ramaria rubella]|nr:hypothetical protein K439DRAFT_1380451 [Ramaria rubella]